MQWTEAEREMLLRPSLEFNPPVRFLQTAGHKQKVGIELDKANLKIVFQGGDAKKKFQHLIRRMLLESSGPGAVAAYEEVFSNFQLAAISEKSATSLSSTSNSGEGEAETSGAGSSTGPGTATTQNSTTQSNQKPYSLFPHKATKSDLSLKQYLHEAQRLNVKNYPGAGTALLRAVVELVMKLVIEEKQLNPQGKLLDIEGAANLLISSGKLSADDKNIVKEFRSSHISYLNLGTHATVIPNYDRLVSARDCIDAFIKRNV